MRTFYSKLSLTLVLAFIVVACILLFFTQRLTTNYQNEVEQKLHVNLAEHIVNDNSLLKNGEIDQQGLKKAFHSMMILGPSFEFYIIEPDGQISTYSADVGKVKRSAVSVDPIHNFLFAKKRFPILGDDPRSLEKQKIFSVAEIRDNGELVAYLYIIIGGELYDGVTDLLSGSHLTQLSLWALSAMLLFTLAVMLITFFLLTRPLKKLSQDVKNYSESGFVSDANSFAQWDGNSRDEVDVLGRHFSAMAEELNTQYRKVKSIDELRRELISYVSHDLRTPLSSLQGYLETWQLKHHDLSAEQSEELIATAMKNAQQMSRLVEQLFELAHLDGDNVHINKEPITIAELAQDVLQQKSLEAANKIVTLDVSPKDPSIIVWADIEKLERVLHNLLDNAIRHCDSGDKVSVNFSQQGGDTVISVSDSGCGIKEEDMPYIFDAHYRASNTATGKGLNSGLGLAICQRIMQLHGSEIAVWSKLGKGTTFSFHLSSSA
ncbi:MAG: HAMP domain-containing histidine kinase [Pseudomonadales bacterium]|nr:HAMP domain-containing histidine kinase [Pseudomonadales bacterium]